MTNISTPVLRRIARWYLIKPLERTVQKIKPDLIISITPFVNEIAVIVAQRNKIPFFLVTVDNDLKNWIFKKQKISYPIIIGHYLSTSAGRLLEKNIHPDDIHVSGFPLRRDFKEIKPTCEEMREKLKLPKQKDIILILMGGAGSTQSEKYAKLLVKSSLKVHVVVICGNNFKQFRYLQALSNPDITPLPFVHNISDYMSVSRLLITKPGPGSIEEAIAMKLLMILDTESILSWEKANVDMVLSYGIGVELRNSRNLVHLVEHVLNNQEQMKRCFYSIKQNSFDETISETAKELLCSKAS
jgi:processive 1,2-diacylglycerol beta-glucosyltransferase